MKVDAPGAEILRQDVITIGGADVGMLAARYTIAPQTNLTQQAIFRGLAMCLPGSLASLENSEARAESRC